MRLPGFCFISHFLKCVWHKMLYVQTSRVLYHCSLFSTCVTQAAWRKTSLSFRYWDAPSADSNWASYSLTRSSLRVYGLSSSNWKHAKLCGWPAETTVFLQFPARTTDIDVLLGCKNILCVVFVTLKWISSVPNLPFAAETWRNTSAFSVAKPHALALKSNLY
jgi:hypothetical protein